MIEAGRNERGVVLPLTLMALVVLGSLSAALLVREKVLRELFSD
jgi:hypothetical protein